MGREYSETQVPKLVSYGFYFGRLISAPSTLDSAYGAIVASIVNTAQDHINVADTLTTQVVDVLKAIEKKNEDLKKKVNAAPRPSLTS